MKLVLPLLCLAAILAPPAPAADDPRSPAVECNARAGIPNALRKLRAGGEGTIRVAYLGGSITAAPGWRVKSLAWLQQRFPTAKLAEINAAIGGTGSDLGVFRLAQDVLQAQPDLLFVEFAVNDGGAEPARIQQAMEGIVRQTWSADPLTDIIFVYTISQPFLDDMKNGRFSRAATAMEEVANHYAIPSIHLGVEVAKRDKAGTLVFKGEPPAKNAAPDPAAPMLFSTDGVHPLVETGHQLYLEVIARAWEQLEKASSSDKPAPHQPGDPLRPDHWAAAKLVPISQSMLTGAWNKLDPGPGGDPIAGRFKDRMPQMWRATEPGAALNFRFRGSMAGIYDILGPDGGQLKVQLDEGPGRAVTRIDGYCTYHRLATFQLGSALDPGRVHTASITLDSAAPDKAHILFEHNRPDLEKDPAKYAANHWTAGSIMLIGDLVE